MGGFNRFLSPSVRASIEPECSRLSSWLKHFDLHFYRTHPHCNGVADLVNLDDAALFRHFVERGWKERRGFSAFLHAFIDPDFYRHQYPELALRNGPEAVAHWMYDGFFEGRIPNKLTRDCLESEIHLFQFGKVASKSIEKALYAAGHRKLILHLHWQSEMVKTYPDCLLSYDEVVNSSPDKVVSFITGVRNPFERIISGFFESNLSGGSAPPGDSLEQLKSDIVRSAFSIGHIDHILGWFKHKFFRDLDIYGYRFEKDAGYSVIEEGNLRVFLYRFENVASLEEPLSRFTGLDIHLERTNTAEGKPYLELYKAVRNSLKFSPEQGDYVLDSQLVRHFYTAQEIDRMRDRWVEKAR